MKEIAVVGAGFVGGTLAAVFAERGFKVNVFDRSRTASNVQGCVNTLSEDMRYISRGWGWTISGFVNSLESSQDERGNGREPFRGIYFVCVPTPMRTDGSCDVSIVESVLDQLSEPPGPSRTVVIKSTVPPGSTQTWNRRFKGRLNIIFSPEFLTEANALEDMRNQTRIIVGGPRPHVNKVKEVFQTAFPKVPIIKTNSTTAEMVKYVTNCFLATKVAFANEVSQICEALDASGLDIDYDKVVEYATEDHRLGRSHWMVPGPVLADDTGVPARGFGGSCFPKDINALMHLASSLGVDPKVMRGAWEKNLEVRPQRDWKTLQGRAVSSSKETD